MVRKHPPLSCSLLLYRSCPLDSPNPKNGKIMVLGRPKTYAKKVVKKWSPPKWSRPKKKPKLSKIPPWGPLRGPQGGVLDSFGFLLGPAPFWR